ncbi:FecR family protein [Methylomonas sp. 2BW1-5-20]|uniref:FecR family protein n=1 Tax=Methylomonas sp. 2BW1-5-20 TaxID=3376686 RepID=UPI0040531855
MTNSTDPQLFEQAGRWVLKLHNTASSDTERRAFKAWLASDPRHLPAYRHAESLWRSFDASSQQPADPQLVNARARFREAQKQTQKPRRAHLRGIALVTLLIAATPLSWQWLNTTTYTTAKGQRLRIILSDGSKIELNTDSQLRVKDTWHSRQATLEQGEAMFDVVHDPMKPFEVAAAAGRIRDVGTRFNVSRWHDTTTVSVLEGEVEVSTASSTLRELLLPGRQISYDQRGSLSAQAKFDAGEVTAWQRDLLVFNNTPLADALNQLSRYHNVELRLADPSLGSLKVSGDFPSKNLDAALQVISAALPVKAAQKSPGLIVLER